MKILIVDDIEVKIDKNDKVIVMKFSLRGGADIGNDSKMLSVKSDYKFIQRRELVIVACDGKEFLVIGPDYWKIPYSCYWMGDVIGYISGSDRLYVYGCMPLQLTWEDQNLVSCEVPDIMAHEGFADQCIYYRSIVLEELKHFLKTDVKMGKVILCGQSKFI